MELFIAIGACWLVGMVAYVTIDRRSANIKRRCNVKNEVIKFKRFNNGVNESARRKV
jgi:hypothetical protein